MSNNATKQNANQETTKPDFGQGRYSAEAERVWRQCQDVLGIASDVAERIARRAVSDAGEVFKQASATLKVSKVSKDGKVTLADASKVKGITVTNALMIIRTLDWIDEAGKNGISYGHTKWVLTPPLVEWVDEIRADIDAKNAAEQLRPVS